MFNPIKHYLIKFAHFLRDRWIKFIAQINELNSDEIEKRYGRPCLVCLKRFIPRFTHHLLCSECATIYLKCWNPSCLNYFQPLNERHSETFCPICRSKGQAKDLLSELYSQTGDSRFNPQASVLYRLGHPIVSERKITDKAVLEAFGIKNK